MVIKATILLEIDVGVSMLEKKRGLQTTPTHVHTTPREKPK